MKMTIAIKIEVSFSYQFNFSILNVKLMFFNLNQLDVELKLNESLPPEQYRETAVDKNQKMKQQLEVN